MPPAPAERWTDEKLAELETPRLITLRDNAARLAEETLVARCDTILADRPATRSRGGRAGRPQPVRDLEKEGAARLASFARSISGRFDLSAETAKQRSEGIKGFRPHTLCSKTGDAKVGGTQRKGETAILRYISYRVKNTVVWLMLYLAKDQPATQASWLIVGTEKLQPAFQPVTDLCETPPLPGEGKEMGMAFVAFDEAAVAFETVIADLAPRMP